MSKIRRVLHLIDTGGPGGAETIFLELVRWLPRHGWDSLPVVPERDWLAGRLRNLNFNPAELSADRSFDLGYVRRLRRLLRRESIDLVQTHLLGTSVYATLACAGTRIPVVSTFHGRPDISPSDRFRSIKSRLLSGRRNRVVCVSESLRRHFAETGDLRKDTEVIPNGIDLTTFVPGRRSQLRSELGLALDVPIVGAVGNVRRSKAYHVLLEAFARVKREIPQAHLVIAGQNEGDLHESLTSLQTRLGITASTHFLGFRDDIAEILGALDVFALSSSDEGFSLATVQAMAMSLPVIATRSGGPEEIIGDSDSGILVNAGDPVALARGIVRALLDRELALSLGQAARQRATSRFGVERMVESYSALYRRVLADRREERV